MTSGQLPASQPLNWRHDVVDIPAAGLNVERSASEVECAQLAGVLDLVELAALSMRYRVQGLAGGGYRLSGRLVADVVQSCVVSLEPVAGRVDEDFEVEFWPQPQQRSENEDAAVLGGADIEVLEGGVIDVGRIVFETLSAGLDPYPRKPDAAFSWNQEAGEKPSNVSPFSVLSQLKDKG